jgi:hypothetical protein
MPADATSLRITTAALSAGAVQSVYAARLAASGGVPPYSWSSGQLPVGLTLNSHMGTIAGTPSAAGTFSFTVAVRDSKASSVSTGLLLVVSPGKSAAPSAPPNVAPLQISTTTLPAGTVQSSYSTTLAVTGGVPPYSWSTASGQLPAGLVLNSAGGTIAGMPTATGNFSFTARVQDSTANSVSASLSLSVASVPTPIISGVSPNNGSIDGGTSVLISGNNFRSGAVVQFGSARASSVQVVSATQIRVMTPVAPSGGTVNITVQIPEAQAATAGNAFTFVMPGANGPGEAATSADAFVDSAGVNVHLHYTNTVYANFTAVQNALTGLGVRHIRDGLIDTTWQSYYDRLNALGRAGIKANLITSANQTAALLEAYPQRVPDSLESYEAPNEYDASGDPNWSATLNAFVQQLHAALKSAPATANFPIVGPSLTQAASYPKMVSASSSFDWANLHNYLGGHNPGTSGWGNNGYGSINWNLALANTAWPGKPVITTETGYVNDLTNSNGVPEDVSGKYLPRLFLEQWLHGIHRTYIYELLDLGSSFSDNGFGLLHNDFSPKVGYNAIKSLLGLLADPGPGFQAGNLDYQLSGNTANVHHLLLQKRDGTFFLALWVEQPCYDMNAKQPLTVAEQSITIATTQQLRMTRHWLDASGNLQTSALGVGQTQTMEVSDQVTILEISQ